MVALPHPGGALAPAAEHVAPGALEPGGVEQRREVTTAPSDLAKVTGAERQELRGDVLLAQPGAADRQAGELGDLAVGLGAVVVGAAADDRRRKLHRHLSRVA